MRQIYGRDYIEGRVSLFSLEFSFTLYLSLIVPDAIAKSNDVVSL